VLDLAAPLVSGGHNVRRFFDRFVLGQNRAFFETIQYAERKLPNLYF
jgi:hypothetical protein